MLLNILGTTAIFLASISTEPRDDADVWARIISVTVILGAIWF